jgi:hypothetical protein
MSAPSEPTEATLGKPSSLFREANAFARDHPRDRMPEGYVWDMVDFVPVMLDSQLTGRGGWKWGSALHTHDFTAGIYAPFIAGDRLLAIAEDGILYDVNLTTGALDDIGGVGIVAQNPVMLRDFVYVPRSDDGSVPIQVKNTAGVLSLAFLPTTNVPKAKYAAVYKERLLLGNSVGQEQRLTFSPPGDPMASTVIASIPIGQWDPYSFFNTSLAITGIGALRASILIFHAGSVERLRGGIPPTTIDPRGDMFMEPLFDRAGCGDARTIAYWQDNCIFADERGVHLTDGATVRNLASQGSILTLWRTLWKNRATVAADTYLDYYVITVIRTDGQALTLVCDLVRRTWFRFSNIKSKAYIHSIGPEEQLWGGRQGAKRLTALSNCFFPTLTELQVDADGTNVLPVLETPWYRFGDEARKRVRFAYTSYDCRLALPAAQAPMNWRGHPDAEGQVLEPLDAGLVNGAATTALAQALEVGFIVDPTDTTYEIAGRLPDTSDYRRYRLPLNRHPYGVAFRVRQLEPSYVTRLYGMQVESSADERSRV